MFFKTMTTGILPFSHGKKLRIGYDEWFFAYDTQREEILCCRQLRKNEIRYLNEIETVYFTDTKTHGDGSGAGVHCIATQNAEELIEMIKDSLVNSKGRRDTNYYE